MTQKIINLDDIRRYFDGKLKEYGPTHQGVDYNSPYSQLHRFEQLLKITPPDDVFSILDFGSGYGSLFQLLMQKKQKFQYYGYDILESMVEFGNTIYKDYTNCTFTSDLESIPQIDFAVASGTFNMKMGYQHQIWQEFVIENLKKMDNHSKVGFSFNLLTTYSDPEFIRSDLYYGDPCFYFDYCKNNFSKNVALLHDYGLYDFTILVRK